MATTLLKDELKNGSLSSSSSIRTISALWKATIEYQEDGVFDSTAIYELRRRCNPRIANRDIFNVISAVYADEYWDVIKMSPSILAKRIVQSGVIKYYEEALKAAQDAMSQWRGILCRKNLSDTGHIPSIGSYSKSIDIVCNGDTELIPAQLIENWNSAFWKEPKVGKNFIYVRVQNKDFVGGLDGIVTMFYTEGGFNQPPSSWIQCYTSEGNKREGSILLLEGEKGLLNKGERGVSEAFFFNPTSTEHVCVIAAIKDQFFKKNDPTKISSNWDSTIWITHNAAAAWHNYDPQKSQVTKLKVYNQDGIKEKFLLKGECRNVPKGYTISLKTEDGIINSGEVVVYENNQFIETGFELPGYYNGFVDVEIKGPKGELLPQESALELTLLWELPKGHSCYFKAVEVFNELKATKNESAIFTSLGSYTIIGKEN